MKHKHFYSHVIETSTLTLEIAELNVDSKERVHLLSLAEANIHSTIVSNVLDNLSEEDKKTFLKNVSVDNHDQTWKHLNSKIKDVENLVKKTATQAIEELLNDIKEVKS